MSNNKMKGLLKGLRYISQIFGTNFFLNSQVTLMVLVYFCYNYC